MSQREIGLGIGDRIGDDFEIIATVAHSTRPESGGWRAG